MTESTNKRKKREIGKVARPGKPQRKLEKAEEPARAEMPQQVEDEGEKIKKEKVVSGEGPGVERTLLEQCVQDPAFRRRVIYHLVKKLR